MLESVLNKTLGGGPREKKRDGDLGPPPPEHHPPFVQPPEPEWTPREPPQVWDCLLYTSDAADDM
eukprot:5344419-Prorocentrum_lima.AAC.1